MNTATIERQSQTEHATIVVQYVNEKKPGQRNASIKDADGAYYWVKPEELHRYQPGVAYEIAFVTTQSNGYTNRTIKNAQLVQQQQPEPRRQAMTVAGGSSIGTRKGTMNEQPNGNGNYYKATSPTDARRMFLCSQLNALITSRQVTLSADGIADAIRMLSAAYDATIGEEDRS
jgi:hypothetical protein